MRRLIGHEEENVQHVKETESAVDDGVASFGLVSVESAEVNMEVM